MISTLLNRVRRRHLTPKSRVQSEGTQRLSTLTFPSLEFPKVIVQQLLARVFGPVVPVAKAGETDGKSRDDRTATARQLVSTRVNSGKVAVTLHGSPVVRVMPAADRTPPQITSLDRWPRLTKRFSSLPWPRGGWVRGSVHVERRAGATSPTFILKAQRPGPHETRPGAR